MLGILWLTAWFQIVVSDAYDEYSDYSSSDGRAKFMGMNWQRNFSEVLRHLAETYGEDDINSIANAKIRLRSVKVYDYTGSGNDFDPRKGQVLPLPEGSKYCSMGRHTRVDCNQCTCVGGQLYLCTGMICPETPHKPEYLITCEEGTKRLIDSCNYCYCQDGRELCTTKDCGQKHNIYLRDNCKEGTQRIVNECNRCVCIHGEEYCSNNICGAKEEALPKFEFKTTNKKREAERTCTEGGQTEFDGCNYCICNQREKFCTQKSCQNIEEASVSNVISLAEREACCPQVDDLNGNCKFVSWPSCNKSSIWKKDMCNECVCLNGYELCTNKTCGKSLPGLRKRYFERRPCYPIQHEQGCNISYICEGSRIKDKMVECPDGDNNTPKTPEIKDTNKTEPPKKQCHFGDTKTIDCNTCMCIYGKWMCSIYKCVKKNKQQKLNRLEELRRYYGDETKTQIRKLMRNSKSNNAKCKFGTTKITDCQTCMCFFEEWMCTIDSCTKNVKPNDKITKEDREKESILFLFCTSGEKRHIRDKPKNQCLFCECDFAQWKCTPEECKPGQLTSRRSGTCTEGAQTQIDACNYCICYKGEKYCTQKSCQDIAKEFLQTRNCEESSKWKKDVCNECICLKGDELCTIKVCEKNLREFKDGNGMVMEYGTQNCTIIVGRRCKPIISSESDKSKIQDDNQIKLTGKQCKWGDVKEVECNTCHCNAAGGWDCTLIGCVEESEEQKAISRNQPDYDDESYDSESSNSESLEKESCQKGDKRTLDSCYECYCAHRIWICENINCEDVYNTEEVDYNDIVKCHEGDAFKIDSCYECDCLDGNWICEKNCDAAEFQNNYTESYYNDLTKLRNNQLQCKSGEIKHKDCNLCICHYNQWVCEQNSCHRDADIQRRNKVSDINEVKYEECNRCICRHNRWVCEDKTCDYDDSSNSESSVVNLLYLESCRNDDKRKLDACNKCYCRNGQWFCENRDCGILEILANIDTEFDHLQTWSSLGDPVCSKKKKRQIDACNFCYCRHGQWFCENKQCGRDKDQLLPLSDDSFRFEKCTRGSIRYDKCNRCICPAGTWICEQKTCNVRPKIIRNLNNGTDILKLLYLQTCRDEEQRKFDFCNKCYCRLGHWFCENKECQNDDAYGTHLNNSMSLSSILKPVCRQERRRKIDACNYCYCLNGQWLCENINCSPTPVAAAEQEPFYLDKQCTYGYKIKIDECNYCYCNANSRFICSKNTCPHLPYDSSAGDKIFRTSEIECVEGTRRPYDNCNYCYCVSGLEFCTLKTCPSRFRPLPFEHSCKPGKVLPSPDSCNECICIDSLIACTNYECLELTAKGLRDSFVCTEGTRRIVDNCDNYCICVDKEEFCTQKFCITIDSVPELLFPEPECDLGESLSDPDPCNECLCLNNEIACTTLPCPEKFGLRSSHKCIDGTRRKLDGCNYCECIDGLEFCTNKTCPITTPKPPFVYSGSECEPGISLPKKDSCNECICINSDILCSNQSCDEKTSALRSECIDGTLSNVNGCNYCICFNGLEFCTQKEVCPPPLPKPLSKYLIPGPECEIGITLPDVDSCNECMCLNYEVVCTKKYCARRSTDDENSADCINGEKRNVGDGCNYCICIDGQEFCTSRACLSTSVTTKDINCEKGEHYFNDCNMCICLQGKFTCTDRPCNHERSGFRKSTTNFKSNLQYSLKASQNIKSRQNNEGRFTKQKKYSEKICTHGDIYRIEDDDPNCPNACVCDNNEILCTNRPCSRNFKKNKRGPINIAQFLNSGCTEYEKLPSDDPCNTCICRNGRKICTVLTCADNEDLMIGMTEEELLTGKKGKNKSHTKIDISFCTPFTFFNPDNNRFCRNCFCLHNGLALCLLHLCKYNKDIANNPPIAPLEPSCTPGDTGYPTKCVVCTCSYDAKWICNRIELELCQDRDCDAKDEFQMGMHQYCARCNCAVKEWYCSVNQKPCSDYSNVKCPIGTFIRNPEQPCSICLCGGFENDHNNLCFTEVKCVHQVQNNL